MILHIFFSLKQKFSNGSRERVEHNKKAIEISWFGFMLFINTVITSSTIGIYYFYLINKIIFLKLILTASHAMDINISK